MQLFQTSRPHRLEDELLLLCARSEKEAGDPEQIRSILRAGLDWPYLRKRALWHGMIPLLCHTLMDLGTGDAPEDFRDQLQNQLMTSICRNGFMTSELFRLLDLFRAHGISAVPYKGPVLATLAYDDPALRDFEDLDFLVHKEDISKAKDLLVRSGYHPAYPFGAREEAAYLNLPTQDSECLWRADGIHWVDLHWSVEPQFLSFVMDSNELWNRLESISLEGFSVQTFSLEDTVLMACIHGAKHRWERLIWLRDLSGLVERHPKLDWDRLLRRANTLGAKRMLCLGLFLAKALLGATPPPQILPMIEGNGLFRSLCHQVHQTLFREIQGQSWPFESGLFFMRTMESLKDKGRYCIKMILTPTPLEWAMLPLPSSLSYLYYPLRGIRLTSKYAWKFLGQISLKILPACEQAKKRKISHSCNTCQFDKLKHLKDDAFLG